MKLRTLIIEDNDKYMDAFVEYISVLDTIDLVGQAKNKQSGIDLIRQLMPDLVLLDIELPHEGEGFDLLQDIGDNISFDIIIITAHAKSDYVNKYGDVNSRLSDSVVKLLYKQEFDETSDQLGEFILKVIENREQPNYISKRQQEIMCLKTNINSKRDSRKILCTKNDNEKQAVFLKDIIYISSCKQYQEVHTRINQRPFIIRHGLSALEDILESYGFLRVHRSYLININYVIHFSAKDRKLILSPDESIELPIGKHKLPEIKDRLNDLK